MTTLIYKGAEKLIALEGERGTIRAGSDVPALYEDRGPGDVLLWTVRRAVAALL